MKKILAPCSGTRQQFWSHTVLHNDTDLRHRWIISRSGCSNLRMCYNILHDTHVVKICCCFRSIHPFFDTCFQPYVEYMDLYVNDFESKRHSKQLTARLTGTKMEKITYLVLYTILYCTVYIHEKLRVASLVFEIQISQSWWSGCSELRRVDGTGQKLGNVSSKRSPIKRKSLALRLASVSPPQTQRVLKMIYCHIFNGLTMSWMCAFTKIF